MNKKDAIRAMLDGWKITRGGLDDGIYWCWNGAFFIRSDFQLVDVNDLRIDTWKIYEEPKTLIHSARSVSPEDVEHLKWIYDRMVEVHGENPNVDYMIKMRQILGIPDEPVYEWQWKIKNEGARAWVNWTGYLTDDEFQIFQLRYSHSIPRLEFEKDESTMRDRRK